MKKPILLVQNGFMCSLVGANVVPGAGLEPAHLAAGDFESPASTDFATRASQGRVIMAHRPPVKLDEGGWPT